MDNKTIGGESVKMNRIWLGVLSGTILASQLNMGVVLANNEVEVTNDEQTLVNSEVISSTDIES